MAAQTHAQDLATQDRLTKNVKDLLWLNTIAAGPNVSPSEALAALKVREAIVAGVQPSRSSEPRSSPVSVTGLGSVPATVPEAIYPLITATALVTIS